MWTDEIVRARFVEAADTERRLPRGGGGQGSPWPAYTYSFEDKAGWGTERLAEDREMRLRRIPPTAAAITRHDEVMGWTANLIDDEKRRRIVWAWAWCRLTGSSFSARCKKNGWVKVTAYRRLTECFSNVAAHLCNKNVFLRMRSAEWVIQETDNLVGVSGSLANFASPKAIIFTPSADTLKTPQAVESFEKYLASINRRRRKERARALAGVA